MPPNTHHSCAVDKRVENLAFLQVGGNEYERIQPGRGGVGGDRVGEVAGRGTGHSLEAKFACAAQRHAHHAILERKCRVVDGVVFHPSLAHAEPLGQAVGLDQRRVADARSHGGLLCDREQFPEAPHRLRTLGQRILG